MKLVVLGADNVWAIENHFINQLKKRGIDVSLFANHTMFLAWYGRSVINKALYKIAPNLSMLRLNRRILDFVVDSNCEAVIIFKGMEIFPSTIKKIRAKGIKTINYNPDHPFVFHGLGSGNKFVKNSIQHYDLYLTYSQTIKRELEDHYGVKSEVIPFGYDITPEDYKKVKEIEEEIAVCFVGNPDLQRATFLSNLSNEGIRVVVYGDDWSKFFDRNTRIEINKKVHRLDFLKALRKYRIQINLFRSHNVNSHNMRSFEVPAIGGIMLAPRTVEHSAFFDEGKEAFYYDDFSECVDQCSQILAMTLDEANKVRQAARLKSLNDGYGYSNRADAMLEEIQTLLN